MLSSNWLWNVQDLGPVALPMKTLRDSNMQEVRVDVGSGAVLRGALVYGFRNIQNFVRNFKRGRCEYDFVEVMACPGGCLNGGGQVRVEGRQASVLERLKIMDAMYHDPQEIRLEWPETDAEAQALYSARAERPLDFRTKFRMREKTVHGSLLDW
jgi:iron only hydrogenase large subunit-like protein